MSPLTFCSLFKGRIQGLYWVLSPTHRSESLWFLAGTSLRGSYTWAWHQRRWSSSLNATWIMRRNLVQQKVSLLSKEQHLSMWRPRVPLLIPKYSTSKSRETQLSMQCQNWEVWSSAMSVHGQLSFWRVLVYDQTKLERTSNQRKRFDKCLHLCPDVTNNPSLLMTLKTCF